MQLPADLLVLAFRFTIKYHNGDDADHNIDNKQLSYVGGGGSGRGGAGETLSKVLPFSVFCLLFSVFPRWGFGGIIISTWGCTKDRSFTPLRSATHRVRVSSMISTGAGFSSSCASSFLPPAPFLGLGFALSFSSSGGSCGYCHVGVPDRGGHSPPPHGRHVAGSCVNKILDQRCCIVFQIPEQNAFMSGATVQHIPIHRYKKNPRLCGLLCPVHSEELPTHPQNTEYKHIQNTFAYKCEHMHLHISVDIFV